VGGDRASVRLATLLLMTYPGAPSIYYGDEIGLPGTNFDPDTRRGMPWDRTETWDMAALDYHKRMIAMRHAHRALRDGAYRRLHADADTYTFARSNETEMLVVAVNVAESPRTIAVPVSDLADGTELEVVFGAAGGRVAGGTLRIDLPARDGVVLYAKM
jgi:cyclomaltodextrinase